MVKKQQPIEEQKIIINGKHSWRKSILMYLLEWEGWISQQFSLVSLAPH